MNKQTELSRSEALIKFLLKELFSPNISPIKVSLIEGSRPLMRVPNSLDLKIVFLEIFGRSFANGVFHALLATSILDAVMLRTAHINNSKHSFKDNTKVLILKKFEPRTFILDIWQSRYCWFEDGKLNHSEERVVPGSQLGVQTISILYGTLAGFTQALHDYCYMLHKPEATLIDVLFKTPTFRSRPGSRFKCVSKKQQAFIQTFIVQSDSLPVYALFVVVFVYVTIKIIRIKNKRNSLKYFLKTHIENTKLKLRKGKSFFKKSILFQSKLNIRKDGSTDHLKQPR
uniref:Uncharacterized protein n=1 Tax=Eustigmatophyceae sp. Chic 10/23 P-6w TaxID=1446905 RepID=A0A3R5V185_9STRA|nr:hypothetical protein [Eustigmatophyceae sp. Chic 10/23 P-6w]QAA11540.1 hypothetical protein [Eustigmatophyceae sp. Chic 10/23 P-6w]